MDSSPGFFRRFIFIEWGATPTIEDRVAGLEDAIFEKEPNAVLDWLLIGLLRYLSNGRLFVPAASLRMKESAMAAADSVLSWADDVGGKVALAPTDAARSSRSKIYAHYCEYCAQAGRLSVSDVVFWTRLKGKWGDDLNTLVSESRKGGVYQKLTNIDLSKDSTAAEAALDKGQVDCSRKRASLIDLYGLVARLPAPIEHIAQPPAICLPPEMDGFALLGEEPWGIVSEPPRRRTGSGVGAPFPVAVWGQARGPISDLVAPS